MDHSFVLYIFIFLLVYNYKIRDQIWDKQMEPQQNFEERMNRMKAYHFRQQKAEALKAKIFIIFKQNYQDKLSFLKEYYKRNLFYKVIKGLIERNIFISQVQQKIERNHDLCTLKSTFLKLKINVGQNLAERQEKEKEKQSKQFLKSQEFRSHTDRLFYQDNQKSNNNQHALTQQHFSRGIQESRRTNRSNYSAINSLQQGKRKFNAIKELPEIKRPLFAQTQRKEEERQSVEKDPVSVKKESELIPQAAIIKKPEVIPEEIQKKGPGQLSQLIQPNKKVKIPNSNDILWLLSTLKLYQYKQIQSITTEYQESLKSQSTINEKGYLSNTKKIITKLHKLSSSIS